ncbi:hypothetical protein [Mycobacterium sp. NAZ190054]|uniref:hypothetical protein n=1 Tax=Mycobacterium sp. NAZ190054 TaxID=1747766 RepID=UPI000799199B|nr:hypothetical protein [Mycobacterium sp. NAZ190054]KWX68132.1 hypothetical protein ASJ79_19045 [Mycobacterium sp. NAZ190054]
MLPTRSRLQGWNPESLLSAAASIRSSGEKFYEAVRNLDDGVDRMPESRVWEGQAQQAAAAMFGRATDRASAFKSYTDEVAARLERGGASIGRWRTQLLEKAAEIDAGPLNVSDQWVVSIDAAGMSAERAAELEVAAKAAQAAINPLLIGLDEADTATGVALLAAQATKGISPDLPGSPPISLAPHPRDDVPSPDTEEGRQFQEAARAEDMATTVRDIDDTTDRDGNRVTTYTMLDGSKHEVTEYIDQGLPSQQVYPPGTTRVLHTDKNGNWISETMTNPLEGGGTKTSVSWADGTRIVMTETPDGVRTGSCITNGVETVLPDSFFTDPLPTLAGGALSGLETKAGQGIPALTSAELDKVKVGAKWGGPAIGLATMAYNMVSAETLHDACVAGVSGTFGTVGGIAIAGMGGAAAGPLGAFVGSVGGSWAFGYVGSVVGEVLCPK